MSLVSIITINFNNSSGLEKTIRSIHLQNFVDYEYIVIDGGSTDESVDIIKKHQNFLDFWISEPDKGVYDAMNKGLEMVKGEYVYFLNSGDTFYRDNVLSKISDIIQREQPDILYGRINDINEVTGISQIRDQSGLNKIDLFKKMVCHQAIFCKRHLFDNNAFDLSLKIKADYAWLLNALNKNPKIHTTDVVIANYLLGGLSDQQYDTYSVKEIPAVRNKFYSDQEQKFLRRYVFNPKFERLPFSKFLKSFFRYITKQKFQNLRIS